MSQDVDHELLQHLNQTTGYSFFPEIRINKSSIGSIAYSRLLSELECFQAARNSKQLIMLSFTSVTDYLELLELVAREIGAVYQSRALFYLAAAVSDFYVPPEKLAEHKIQSHGGAHGGAGLTLNLDNVPKKLGDLVSIWAPHSFVVSFKLETDTALVISKARRAIESYGVHLVVANLLQTRRNIVYLVSPRLEDFTDEVTVEEVHRPSVAESIDPYLVGQVVRKFFSWLAYRAREGRQSPRGSFATEPQPASLQFQPQLRSPDRP